MIDLRELGEKFVWPDCLEPRGYGELAIEDFSSWWKRNGEKIAHLPDALAEQWVHRHWRD